MTEAYTISLIIVMLIPIAVIGIGMLIDFNEGYYRLYGKYWTLWDTIVVIFNLSVVGLILYCIWLII